MRIRPAKVRVTNYRPPGAGASRPLERATVTRGGSMTGLDHLDAINRQEAAEHDRAIADYDEDTLLAIACDLGKRYACNRKDPEQRWVMARKAAVLRLLDRKGAFKP